MKGKPNISIVGSLLISMFLLLFSTMTLAEPIVVGRSLGVSTKTGSKISSRISRALNVHHPGLFGKIEETDCKDTTCQLRRARNDGELLITTEIANMLGIYIISVSVFNIENGEKLTSFDIETNTIAQIPRKLYDSLMEKDLQELQELIKKAPEPVVKKKEPIPSEPVVEKEKPKKKRSKRLYQVYNTTAKLQLSPFIGYQPNDPLVKRNVVGLQASYFFNKEMAFDGTFIFSPDNGLSDIKPLTNTLVQIAYEGSANLQFQQPLDKLLSAATFAARWNLLGTYAPTPKRIQNFTVYGTAGLGMLSTNLYYAQYDDTASANDVPVKLVAAGRKIRIPLIVGLGSNIHLNRKLSLKIDYHRFLYRALKPQYDPEVPVTESRLDNVDIFTIGLSTFLPGNVKLIKNPYAKLLHKSQAQQYRTTPYAEIGLGNVINDPFLNRYLFIAGYTHYLRKTFNVKLNAKYSPDLGDADWKPLTKQLVEENGISPDISKMGLMVSAAMGFEPYNVYVSGRRLTFGFTGGMGIIQTVDDLSALQAEEDERAQSTQVQFHPMAIYGPYFLMDLGKVGVSFNLTSKIHIETVNGTTLEMKNNLCPDIRAVFFL